LLLLMCTSSE